MISILIPRKAFIKKIVLNKLMVVHSRFSGKDILTDSRAGGRLGKVCRITTYWGRLESKNGQRKKGGHSVLSDWVLWSWGAGWPSAVAQIGETITLMTLPSAQRTLLALGIACALLKESLSQRRQSAENSSK